MLLIVLNPQSNLLREKLTPTEHASLLWTHIRTGQSPVIRLLSSSRQVKPSDLALPLAHPMAG
jgi:hypothetical protein